MRAWPTGSPRPVSWSKNPPIRFATQSRAGFNDRGGSCAAIMRRTLGQIRIFLSDNPLAAMATNRLSRRARAAVYLYRLALRILAQWARDKCPQQAAALAFQTALSLVPVTAIAFTILRAVGSLDAESRLSQFIAEHVFPNMADVTARISEFSGKVSIGALG